MDGAGSGAGAGAALGVGGIAQDMWVLFIVIPGFQLPLGKAVGWEGAEVMERRKTWWVGMGDHAVGTRGTMLSSVPQQLEHHELAGPRASSLLGDPPRSCTVALLPPMPPAPAGGCPTIACTALCCQQAPNPLARAAPSK